MLYDVIYEDIGFKDYKETWDYQDEIFRALIKQKTVDTAGGNGREKLPGRVIFVEHPHVYTLGKSGSENNLLLNYIQLQARNASFYRIDRGGDITYHGPGQIVGYPIIDLELLGISLKEYVYGLEEAVILTLSDAGIMAGRLDGATGVWLDTDIKGRTRKICAIGVRASRYVTMHGFAFNVNTDLSYFSHINPCGFTDKGVTSVEKETGKREDMERFKMILKNNLASVFGFSWVNRGN
jgi:lipoyl(octanoyl) transferase